MSTIRLPRAKIRLYMGVALLCIALFIGLIIPAITDTRGFHAVKNVIVNVGSPTKVSITMSATPTGLVPINQRVTFTGSTTGLADGTHLSIYLWKGGDVHQGGGTNPYALSVYVYSNLFSTSKAVYVKQETKIVDGKETAWYVIISEENNARLIEGTALQMAAIFSFYADYPNPPPPNNVVSNFVEVKFDVASPPKYQYTVWINDNKVFENGQELMREIWISSPVKTRIQFTSQTVPDKVWLNVAALDPSPNPNWHGVTVDGRSDNDEMTKKDASTFEWTESYPSGKFEFKITTGGWLGDPNAVILLSFNADTRAWYETLNPIYMWSILLAALGVVLVVSAKKAG